MFIYIIKYEIFNGDMVQQTLNKDTSTKHTVDYIGKAIMTNIHINNFKILGSIKTVNICLKGKIRL